MTRSLCLLLALALPVAFAAASGCGSRGAVQEPCDAAAPQTDAGDGSAGCDQDGDGYASTACGGDDCDDTRQDIHPGAAEVCDGDDNDCDSTADENDACDCRDAPPKPSVPYADEVCLKGGWFWMGMGQTDPDAKKDDYISVPVHPVFVSPYYLDAYEVTNRRYIACIDAGVCTVDPDPVTHKPWDKAAHSTPGMLDRPFVAGSAQDGEKFCKWAGGWLPSEAQWERAAAGLGDHPRPYPDGNDPPTCKQEVTADCFPDAGTIMPVQPVGTKTPNPEGLYDMAGNADEYTADLFWGNAYANCPGECKDPCFGCPGSDWRPDGGTWPYGHTARGDGIGATVRLTPYGFRSQIRDFSFQDGRTGEIMAQGFRCAYPAKPKK